MMNGKVRGDGYIKLRGKWHSFLSVDGKLQRTSCKTRDEKTAQKFHQARLKEKHRHELDANVPFLSQKARRQTINDLLDALESDFALRGKLSPPNLSNIKRCRHCFGSVRALALTPEEISGTMQALRAEGYANASINRVTQMLTQSFRFAGLPAPRVTRLDESGNVRRGFFSELEVRRVLMHLPDDVRDFFAWAWCTGQRKKEIRSLRWEMLDGDVLTIPNPACKNRKGRSLPVIGEMLEIIVRRREKRAVEVDGVVTLCPWIFHTKGSPIDDIRKSWATACRLAGVPQKLFHDTRRSAVRDMIRAGGRSASRRDAD